MIPTALAIHMMVNVDSTIETTRIFWREKAGASADEARDPRPFDEVLRNRRSTHPPEAT